MLLSRLFFPVRSVWLLASRDSLMLSLSEDIGLQGCTIDAYSIVTRPFVSIRPASFFRLLLA